MGWLFSAAAAELTVGVKRSVWCQLYTITLLIGGGGGRGRAQLQKEVAVMDAQQPVQERVIFRQALSK